MSAVPAACTGGAVRQAARNLAQQLPRIRVDMRPVPVDCPVCACRSIVWSRHCCKGADAAAAATVVAAAGVAPCRMDAARLRYEASAKKRSGEDAEGAAEAEAAAAEAEAAYQVRVCSCWAPGGVCAGLLVGCVLGSWWVVSLQLGVTWCGGWLHLGGSAPALLGCHISVTSHILLLCTLDADTLLQGYPRQLQLVRCAAPNHNAMCFCCACAAPAEG